MPILGLMSTESFSAERFTNVRRKVFYMYPNGSAPLTGILSLLKEEPTNDPTIQWYEKRYVEQKTTTASHSGGAGPFATSGDVLAADPFNWTAGTVYIVTVASTNNFRPAHVLRIPVLNNVAATVELYGVVTEIVAGGTIKMKVRATNTVNNVINGAANENVGANVLAVGTSYSEGSLDISREVYTLPDPFTNFTQIFRTPFTITGTAWKTEAKYDDSGPYKDKAKEHSLTHMLDLEKSIIWGIKSTYVGADGLPQRTFDGLIAHLRNWEAANSVYRGGAGAVAVTLDTDDDKRIIENTSGNISFKLYDDYVERLFRVTNNMANEKLCLCGSGHLKVLNQLFAGRVQLQSKSGSETPFGMPVKTYESTFGTIHYHTHPMMTKSVLERHNGLYLDIHALQYRPMDGRDTDILKNRQANDADYRKDEWLTEASVEIKAPESHMYIKNLQNVVA